MALMALPVAPTYAAALTVTSNADTIAVDGQCTLREAIINANVDGGAGTTAGFSTVSFDDWFVYDAGGENIAVASKGKLALTWGTIKK